MSTDAFAAAWSRDMKHFGKTPPFRGPRGEPVSGSIAEVRYLRVGGIDQSVMIRGESIYLDQRGAGKSFDHSIPTSSMTVEQLVTDLDELVTYVCKRLGTSKVTIFGQSWGSALGVLYAARFPQKVSAYVGSGQYGDCAAEAASYAFAVAEARRRNNRKALLRGFRFSQNALLAEASRLNLLKLVPALQMPVFFFLGRR